VSPWKTEPPEVEISTVKCVAPAASFWSTVRISVPMLASVTGV
jgi:hypothetical protein